MTNLQTKAVKLAEAVQAAEAAEQAGPAPDAEAGAPEDDAVDADFEVKS
jgi:hypothetical protein